MMSPRFAFSILVAVGLSSTLDRSGRAHAQCEEQTISDESFCVLSVGLTDDGNGSFVAVVGCPGVGVDVYRYDVAAATAGLSMIISASAIPRSGSSIASCTVDYEKIVERMSIVLTNGTAWTLRDFPGTWLVPTTSCRLMTISSRRIYRST